jgi:hypothetical protein
MTRSRWCPWDPGSSLREKFFGDWVNGQGEKERAQWVPLLDAAERVQCVRPKDEIGADGVAPLRSAGKSGEVFPDLLESGRSADWRNQFLE